MDGAVVVMDYSQFEREKVKHVLGKLGRFEAIELPDKAAAESFAADPRDCVLAVMDIAFPTEEAGFGLFELMRKTPGLMDIPVIVTSKASSPENKIRASRLQAYDFIVKPYRVSRLEQSMKSLFTAMKKFTYSTDEIEKISMTFDDYIERELKLAKRLNTELSLILLTPSEMYPQAPSGPETNSENTLIKIKGCLRSTDTIVSNGKSDIIIVLPGAGRDGAKAVMDKLDGGAAASGLLPETYGKASVTFPEDGETFRILMENAHKRITGRALLKETASVPASIRKHAETLYNRFRMP